MVVQSSIRVDENNNRWIFIDKQHLDEWREENNITDIQIEKARDIINSIYSFIYAHGLKEGWRNDIAVDLSIALYILGVNEPDDIIKYFENMLDIIDMNTNCCFTTYEKNDFIGRLIKVFGYLEGWMTTDTDDKGIGYGCLPSYWLNNTGYDRKYIVEIR